MWVFFFHSAGGEGKRWIFVGWVWGDGDFGSDLGGGWEDWDLDFVRGVEGPGMVE